LSIAFNKSFWNGKKVLITGHSGFKGSWLTLLLNYLGAEVCGVSSAALNNNQELFTALNLDKYCDSHDLDIRNHEVAEVFDKF
jgi:CDP-glucose 4,6-dehydratase